MLKYKLRAFVSYARQYGWSNATIFALFKLFPKKFTLLVRKVAGSNAAAALATHDFAAASSGVFEYKRWEEFGGASAPASPLGQPRRTIVWFVPDWSNVWGGGHFTLFRFAHHFAKRGTRNVIYIYNNERHESPAHLQRELESALGGTSLEVIVDRRKLPRADGAIATTWQSAYQVRAFPFAASKFYFMQDYESQFYAYGTASMQAAATYGFGFHGITGGTWLRSKYLEHGGQAINYRFAADKGRFFPERGGAVRPKVQRLFFYGRPSTERRCFELGLASLDLISKRFADVEIVIGGLDLAHKPPFAATLMGNMSLAKTAELYRTCDVGMAFSATNLSYLPVELMQSGIPVLSNNGAHVEWHCRSGENSLLVDPVPQAVLEGFARLYESTDLRQRLVDGGLSTMAPLSWDNEMDKVFEHMTSILNAEALTREMQAH